jgi:hypothetical protein
VNGGGVETRARRLIAAPYLPPLDRQMCRVSLSAFGAGVAAVLLGWTAVGVGAIFFGVLTLWLAAQLAAAPCCEDESDGE